MNKLRKLLNFLWMFLVVFLICFLTIAFMLAYIVNFDFFFWNAGAIPLSAWWEFIIEHFSIILILTIPITIPVVVWWGINQ